MSQGGNNSEEAILIKQIEKGVLKHYGKAFIESGRQEASLRQTLKAKAGRGGKKEKKKNAKANSERRCLNQK